MATFISYEAFTTPEFRLEDAMDRLEESRACKSTVDNLYHDLRRLYKRGFRRARITVEHPQNFREVLKKDISEPIIMPCLELFDFIHEQWTDMSGDINSTYLLHVMFGQYTTPFDPYTWFEYGNETEIHQCAIDYMRIAEEYWNDMFIGRTGFRIETFTIHNNAS